MQSDVQIRVHKIGKNSVISRGSLEARGLERAPLHDAMELRVVTIEILGVPMYTGSFWQRRKVWIICATLSLRERVPFLQLRSSDRRCLSRRERCDYITVWRRRKGLVSRH